MRLFKNEPVQQGNSVDFKYFRPGRRNQPLQAQKKTAGANGNQFV